MNLISFALVHAWEVEHHPVDGRGCHLENNAVFNGQELDCQALQVKRCPILASTKD